MSSFPRLTRALALPLAASTLALTLSASGFAANGSWSSNRQGDMRKAASASCTEMNSLLSSPSTNTTDDTNGIPSTFTPGEVITLTVAAGTSTSSSVSIVYDANPASVLVGPLTGPGTLTYTVPATSPIGIGYWVNSVTPTDTSILVSMRCAEKPATAVPVWGLAGGLLSALSLGGFAALYLRRRKTV